MNSPVLQSLSTRLFRWQALRNLLLWLAILGGVALAAILLDAALDLSESSRVAAPYLLALCAVAVPVIGFWQWRRFNEQHVARLFERADTSLGNRLINAVQFSKEGGTGAVEEFLRREAIELGRKAAAGVVTWPAVRRQLKLAAAAAGVAVAAWLCLLLLGSDLMQAITPRFLDPRGDHPPYSKLKIEVSPGRAEVLYGGQIEVRAKASGRVADKLWLVAKSGANTTRTLMFLAPDKAFFQTLANLREPAEYFVTDGRARSYRFPIGLRYTPQITMVEVTTVLPEYTGKPPHTGKMAEEAQAFPEDTHISFRVASNRPLKSGRLTLTPVLGGKPTQVELKPEGQESLVTGGFTLTQPVVFTLSVCDIAGLDCADPRQGRFNILPDERPRIFVLEPGRDAVATPTISVPVRVQAEDDYGITRVMWLHGHNRSIERPLNMKLTLKTGPQSVEATGAFDFAKLGVRPGDVIDYYFEAADNYPKGPNVTLSRPYRVQIISEEQYKEILRQAAARKALFEPYFNLDRWLQRLAERARTLEKQAANGQDSQQQTKDTAALAKDLEEYENQLGKLLQQAVMFDVEQSFRNTLVEQHTRVSQARRKLEAVLGTGQLSPKELGELGEELSQLAQTEQEDVGQPAQQIAEVARLLARADSFVKLARQQAALAQLLRRFADRNGDLSRVEQIEMQELAYQQRRIEQGLRSLLGELPELMSKLPQDDLYQKLRDDVGNFISAVNDAKIEADLANNSTILANLDGKSGYTLALDLADRMDKLIAKCQGNLPQDGKLCLRFKPSVQQALGDTLAQILAAMGTKPGNGQGGSDGYALFDEDAALYGPDSELAGDQAGGRGDTARSSASGRAQRVAGTAPEPGARSPEAPGRVRLQPDAKFPLRYRDLVGEYFRAIAESAAENEGAGGGKK